MSENENPRIVSASLDIAADAELIFGLIADPVKQPLWDGNDNLGSAPPQPPVQAVGDMFTMTLSAGAVRHNHVVEFEDGRRIAWCPSEPDSPPPGHLWRWELEPYEDARTRVTHTYDWTELADAKRIPRAQATGVPQLEASLRRLAELAEQG